MVFTKQEKRLYPLLSLNSGLALSDTGEKLRRHCACFKSISCPGEYDKIEKLLMQQTTCVWFWYTHIWIFAGAIDFLHSAKIPLVWPTRGETAGLLDTSTCNKNDSFSLTWIWKLNKAPLVSQNHDLVYTKSFFWLKINTKHINLENSAPRDTTIVPHL